MAKVIIRNPMIYHTGPMTAVAYTESEMSYFCIEENVDKLIKYAGTSGVFENGAYYKVVADPVIPEEPDTSDNLLSEPIKSAEPWVGNEVNYGFWEMPSLGLEVGKTYRLTGYYGGESIDSSEGATTFSEDVVAISAEDEMGVVGGVMLIYSKELVADGGYSFGFGFYDKIRLEGDMTVPPTPVYDESVTNFAWMNGGSDEYRPLVKNAVLESIVEVEASSNLLSEPVIFETAGHEEMIEVSPIGIVAGKSYKVSGTYGTPTTAFEFTAIATGQAEGSASMAMLQTPTESLFNGHLGIIVQEATGTYEGEVLDQHIIMIGGFANSGYNDEFFANDTYSPVVINSITEA